MSVMADYKRKLGVVYRDGHHNSYEFNNFEELKLRNDVNLKNVIAAQLLARWPKDSVDSRRGDWYVETKDAKKILVKMGFKVNPPKTQIVEEISKPEPEIMRVKPNGISLIKNRESVVSYNGIEFNMPLYRNEMLHLVKYGEKGVEVSVSDFQCLMKASSHKICADKKLVMIGLEEILDKAEKCNADLVTFTPTLRDYSRCAGAYTFFKFLKPQRKEIYAGYDVSVLKQRLGK